MKTTSRVWCVVPAAGVGKRVGGPTPKQYLSLPELGSQGLSSKLIIEMTLERLITVPVIEKVVVVIGETDQRWRTLSLSTHNKIVAVEGGAERFHSVLNGLMKLKTWAADDDWVLVHDVARPCVRLTDIENLIERVTSVGSASVGGLLGYPVRDTMKRSNPQAEVVQTVEREGLWHALTPQMFRIGPLCRAIETCILEGHSITDESSAMENGGARPTIVEGSADNIKITRPEDLLLAAMYLRQQLSGNHSLSERIKDKE